MEVNQTILTKILDDKNKINQLFEQFDLVEEPHKSVLWGSFDKMSILTREPSFNYNPSKFHPIYGGRSLNEVINIFNFSVQMVYYKNPDTYQFLINILNQL